jgi:hypothetical protein
MQRWGDLGRLSSGQKGPCLDGPSVVGVQSQLVAGDAVASASLALSY